MGPEEAFDVTSVVGEGTTFGFKIYENCENKQMSKSVDEELFSEELDSLNEAAGK